MTRCPTDGTIPTLEVALGEHLNVDDLKKLAALIGCSGPTRKAELVHAILEHLAGDRLRAIWQGMDDLQRAAVAEVVHSDLTRFPADRFRAKYGKDPAWGSLDAYRREAKPTPLRLFFYAHGIMPDDLKARLQAFVPPPARPSVHILDALPPAYDRPISRWNPDGTKSTETEPVPLAVRETERTAQRELLSLLRLVDDGKVAVSDKTRRPSAATLAAIAGLLEGGDFYADPPSPAKWHDENAGPIRAFAWPLLLQAGGLTQLSGTRLRLTQAGRKALADPPAETLRKLWERWVGTTLVDELSRIECVKGQTGKGKRGLTAATGRRAAVADTLAECPAQHWLSTDDLFCFLRASGHEFAVSRNAWDLYIGELQYGSLGYDGVGWLLEVRYLLCLLFEYAGTLGLLDVAFIPPAGARSDYDDLWGTDDLPYFSRYDGLMYVRINALGASTFGHADAYRPPAIAAAPVLQVLPNLEIVAIAEEVAPSDRLALDAYAARVSDRVWRLHADTLLAAIEAGRALDEIREFLAIRSGAPLPETVVRLLDDVAGRSDKVHDRGLVRLIECADPTLAALIAHDTRTHKHCLRAGERHLVVAPAAEAAFRRGLRDLGYLLATGESGQTKTRRARGDNMRDAVRDKG
jgi:hypothetical protein